MTEERMICEWNAGWGEWDVVEPAPPKDWKPMCYYERDDIVGCSVNLPETWEDAPEPIKACYMCPYRRLRIK